MGHLSIADVPPTIISLAASDSEQSQQGTTKCSRNYTPSTHQNSPQISSHNNNTITQVGHMRLCGVSSSNYYTVSFFKTGHSVLHANFSTPC
jgi:hypothetical protein